MLKTLWRGLGANLSETNAQRIASSLESLELVMDSVDNDCSWSGNVGHRSQGKSEEAVKQIVSDLMEKGSFQLPVSKGRVSFIP